MKSITGYVQCENEPYSIPKSIVSTEQWNLTQ